MCCAWVQVLKGTYEPLPDTYSESMREIVYAMLQKDVKKRPNVNELLQVCPATCLAVAS